MALVAYGGGIIQMSGSIAGNTFAHNKSGNYVRARTKPVNPNTARQQTIRAAIAELTVHWAHTLTANQRTAWNLYADNVNMKNRLGTIIHLSGFNHYIRSNTTLWALEKGRKDNGPVVFELPTQDLTLAVTASEAAQQLSIAFDITKDWAAEDGAYLWLFQGQPQNPQRNFFAGPWRYVGFVQALDPGPVVSPVVVNVSFPIGELQRQWIYARIIRADGRLSEAFRADCFCAA
ncbi:unnamed protein product [marine sediment metagenome]|uniref:Uncharacterized protein n=1 Tax=marine sediment metagenome TaxID=412755 RepID=X0ZAV3_9ZZZZ